MSPDGTLDRDLARWLTAEAPAEAPPGLHAAVIDLASAARQRPAWRVAVRGGTSAAERTIGRPKARGAVLLVILGLALATAAIVVAGGAFRSVPVPVRSAGEFIRPFEYVIPRTSTMVPTLELLRLHAFTQGSGEIYPRDPDGKLLPGVRGITVASTDGAVTHPCPIVDGGSSRVPVGAPPQAFLDDLRRIAGIGLGEPSPSTVGDRPALAVTVDPGVASCEYGDFHVANAGIGSGYVDLNVPSRLWLVEVDGLTVVVQVWAGTDDDLAAWLPIASEFLDSVHFVQHP